MTTNQGNHPDRHANRTATSGKSATGSAGKSGIAETGAGQHGNKVEDRVGGIGTQPTGGINLVGGTGSAGSEAGGAASGTGGGPAGDSGTGAASSDPRGSGAGPGRSGAD